MNKLKLITIYMLMLTSTVFAQTKYDKIVRVTLNDFSENCDEEDGDAPNQVFCLTDEQGIKIKERYSCISSGNVLKVEPKDLTNENGILNSKYKGKKATLYCVKHIGGAGWVVKKVELDGGEVPTNLTKQETQSDKLLMADGRYEFNNEEISLSFSITNSGKTISGMVINMIKSGMLRGDGAFVNANNIGGYQFQTGSCLFEFDLPTDKLVLRQSGCKYGEPTKEFALTKKVMVADKNMAIDYEKLKLENDKNEKENSIKFTSNNSFSTASAKVANDKGEISAIVENNFVYRIRDGIKGKKAECSEMPIKNGNQFFSTRGGFNDYQKVVIDNAGIVKLFCATEAGEKLYLKKFSMKEIKEGFIIGKIVNNKFCVYINGGFTEGGYLFKGNKTHAVICLLAFNYFR